MKHKTTTDITSHVTDQICFKLASKYCESANELCLSIVWNYLTHKLPLARCRDGKFANPPYANDMLRQDQKTQIHANAFTERQQDLLECSGKGT